MILDVGQNPKSPITIPDSPTSHNTILQSPQTHVSYATFTSTSSQVHDRGSNAPVSDTTGLLAHSYDYSIGDEQPPAYDEIRPKSISRKIKTFFGVRFATIAVIGFLVCSAWAGYNFYRFRRSIPDTRHPPSNRPPPLPSGPLPSLPPPPNHLPNDPDAPYIIPTAGRTDLCHPWAYSAIEANSRPSTLENRPTDRLSYTVPSLAPIYIETEAICPGLKSHSKRCTKYDGMKDAIAGKLQVVGGDIDLPKIDITVQHGSGQGLEDFSICLMRRPRQVEKKAAKSEDYRWVLGVYIWKDLDQSGNDSVLAGITITLVLPNSYLHDLSTRLQYFTQIIGSTEGNRDESLSFRRLSVKGDYGHILVQNVTAAVIESTSFDSDISVEPVRITESVDLRSTYGIVGCNATLIYVSGKDPVSVNIHSEAGTVVGLFDLEYPSNLDPSPRFDITVHSQLSRAVLWVTDPQGNKALRSNSVPSVLPNLSLNLTSWFANAQALVPATYYGSLDLSSRYAAVVTNDRASELPGRKVRWFGRGGGASMGEVKWSGRDDDGGQIHVSAEYAAVKLLFLGLNDDGIQNWPKEGDETDPRWKNKLVV
ncbi:hypothetical protein FRC09_004052 [Ceratobasidium sp. 395]|nr:hypothetical protein FRC09_004052 [Ceratobasidium sp. 395]